MNNAIKADIPIKIFTNSTLWAILYLQSRHYKSVHSESIIRKDSYAFKVKGVLLVLNQILNGDCLFNFRFLLLQINTTFIEVNIQ